MTPDPRLAQPPRSQAMSSLIPDDDLTVIPPIARRPASAATGDHNTEGGGTDEGNVHADAASQIAAQPTTSVQRTAPPLSTNAHSSTGDLGNAVHFSTQVKHQRAAQAVFHCEHLTRRRYAPWLRRSVAAPSPTLLKHARPAFLRRDFGQQVDYVTNLARRRCSARVAR